MTTSERSAYRFSVIPFLLLLLAGWYPVSLGGDQEADKPGERTVVEGRIVLFDWAAHAMWVTEDFVVQLSGGDTSKTDYVRVIYLAVPGSALIEREFRPLDQSLRLRVDAFVGRGDRWRFLLHRPRTQEERAFCERVPPNHPVKDEMGEGEIPRYVTTPGAQIQEAPDIQSLPCYVLEHDGLEQVRPRETNCNSRHENPN